MTTNSSCIFCKIIERQTPADILYEDDELIIFKDIKPASKYHYLVIPKKHIKAANYLTYTDLPLVKHMIEVGKRILIDNGGDSNDMRLGFHWPPFYSISHLHLHVISPVSEFSLLSRQTFKYKYNFWFVTSDYMLNRLSKDIPCQILV